MKKCIMCEEDEAKYCIRGMPNQCYCEECAKEQFGDLATLEKLKDSSAKVVDEVKFSESGDSEDNDVDDDQEIADDKESTDGSDSSDED